jgi:hypothetical protein
MAQPPAPPPHRPLQARVKPLSAKQHRIARKIIGLVAEGESLKSLLAPAKRPKGWPSAGAFYHWIQGDKDLHLLYQSARELSAYSLEDEALQEVRDLMKGATGDEIRAASELLKQLRWSAEKRNNTAFGPKPLVAGGTIVQIFTSLDLGQEGVEEEKQEEIYDVEFTEVPEEAKDG